MRVLKQLLEDEETAFPLANTILKHSIYIEDLLFGGSSKHLARKARDQLIALLNKAKLKSKKWTNNYPELLSDIDPTNHGLAWTDPSTGNGGIKILSLGWNPDNDQFYYNVNHSLLKL